MSEQGESLSKRETRQEKRRRRRDERQAQRRFVRQVLRRRWWLPVLFAVWLALGLVTLGPVASLAGDTGDTCGDDMTVLDLEFAGDPGRVEAAILQCSDGLDKNGNGQVDVDANGDGKWDGEDIPFHALDGLRNGLMWDSTLFIPLYVLLLAAPSVIAYRWTKPRSTAGQGLLRIAIVGSVLAGAFDGFENLCLHLVLEDPNSDTWTTLSYAAALAKWALVVFCGVVALRAWAQVLLRLPCSPHDVDHRHWRSTGDGAHDRAFDIPDRPADDTLAITCSGGGIRSGTFCMGAVQSFSETPWPGSASDRSITRTASVMTSVSGGGYFAGARQILLHQDRMARPDSQWEPFQAGSHEEDHVRRHGKYLADNGGEWVAAVSRILAGLVLNLGLLLLILFLVARPIGYVQTSIVPCQRGELQEAAEEIAREEGEPVAQADEDLSSARGCLSSELDIGIEQWAAPGLAAGVALAFVLLFVLRRERSDTSNPFHLGDIILRLAAAAAIAAIGAAVITLLAPAVAHGLRLVLGLGGNDDLGDRTGAAASSGTLFALIATALRVVAGGRLASLKKLVPGSSVDHAGEQGPGRLLRLAHFLAGLAVAVCALVIFASLLEDAQRRGPRASSLFGWDDWAVTVLLAGVLFLLYRRADQTTWSLHALYRRRLSTAFALTPDDDHPGRFEELPYSEPTTLSTWADPSTDQPKLVLCAAANLSGSDVAPPGRRAVTFTFESDWVGSPQLGYMRTTEYEQSLPRSIGADTTLLAGMAISGAAVASAMGRHSKGSLQALLAIFNVRLGVWLPTPDFADEVRQGWAWKPKARRFNYLFREIFGLYDSAEAFTYVSDGGHYENLGLVEALRRRPTYVLCLDASGGPGTLVEAIQLAETELGVTIDVDDRVLAEGETAADNRNNIQCVRAIPTPTSDGDADPLAGRSAPSAVLVAKITYPAVTGLHAGDGGPDLPAKEGWLVYGRAVLTDESPPTVAEYAKGNRRFPNDPTGDQWFDTDQFDNYLLLGRHVGRKMVDALTPLVPQPPRKAAAKKAAARR